MDQTLIVTRKKRKAVLRKSSRAISILGDPCPARKSVKKCKYCPNVCDQKEQIYLVYILIQNV